MKSFPFFGLAWWVAAAAAAEPPRIVVPNGDGVIDVAAAPSGDASEPVPNPFRPKPPPPAAPRELSLTIGAVSIAEDERNNSAVINGRLYSAGDPLEGLLISAIRADAIDLQAGGFLVRIPVRDEAIRLRLAR